MHEIRLDSKSFRCKPNAHCGRYVVAAFARGARPTLPSSWDRFTESLVQAKKALELDPELWITHEWLAGTYWRLGRKQEAIALWEKVLGLAGYHAWTWSRLTVAYWGVD
jgi:tetratricopeptide (TPR) repeat protein